MKNAIMAVVQATVVIAICLELSRLDSRIKKLESASAIIDHIDLNVEHSGQTNITNVVIRYYQFSPSK